MGLTPVRYVAGGWSALVACLAQRARNLGVEIETGERVRELPEPPVIVATRLDTARRLTGDDRLRWTGARTALLDIGLEHGRKRGPAVVFDLDGRAFAERYSAQDPSLAPEGHDLIQLQTGARPGEDAPAAVARLEKLLDAGYPRWGERLAWRRQALLASASGAIDLPGTTWRDRPQVERGEGVFVAGDMMAAPGLLGEVAHISGLRAATGAMRWAQAAAAPHRQLASDRRQAVPTTP